MKKLRVAKRRLRYALKVATGQFSEPVLREERYGIRPSYRHRLDNDFFDDVPLKDEWQREVYEAAAEISRRINAESVADVGCGSGFKLMKHFRHVRTAGFELEPTLSHLRATYPDRDWREASFSAQVEPVDMVICADVIEHIPNPDELMSFLASIRCKTLVLSTPERRLAYGWDHSGPPTNRSHCREWLMHELVGYVARWFEVLEAKIANERQATQMLVCGPRT